MSAQYIFTTHKLSRRYPPDKEVLTDISLSFYPGAKIGVLGYNGAGKSTLLQDHGRDRHRVRRPGPAGPQRHGRTAGAGARARSRQGRQGQRRGRRRRDPRAARSLQRAVDELLRRDRRRVLPRAGADRRRRRLEPRHHARVRHGRAALPAARRRRDHALRWRAAPGGDVPAAAAPARPAAARRAHQPPRRRVGGMARAAPAGLQGHDRGHHPRSLLPGQRRRLDPRARPRPRHPLPGQLLRLAGAEAEAPQAGGAPGVQPPAHDRAGARVGADERLSAARQAQGAPQRL